ncbi:MAG: right-handed parallel beta-helix repeat-containing protein [Anaerolineae bacterium]|nr:right-handed parallel beta-helix repeat-containing protein [Anaerolineae bacterium]
MTRIVALICTIMVLLTHSIPGTAQAASLRASMPSRQIGKAAYPHSSRAPGIASAAMISVTIDGEAGGVVDATYFFTATVEPMTAILPITYTWEATGQTAQVRAGKGLTDTLSFTWSITGTKTITVTAGNATSEISSTHTIHIAETPAPSPTEVYLPLALSVNRNNGVSSEEEALDELDDYQATPDIAGTAYYVANDGNDDNNGTAPETPWKTIAKVNGQALSPGDGVLFRRGDVWRELLVVASSGIEGAPVTYGAYGEGKAPAILGSTAITGWVNVSGNIWRGNIEVADPSRGAPHDGSEIGSGGWPGGAWFVSLDGTVRWGNQEKYLSGGYQVLQALYDWGWDAGYIYIYSEGDPASRWQSLEVSQRSSAIEMAGNDPQDWVVIDNIQMLFTQSKGFFAGYPALEAEGLTIEHCHVAWVGIRGGLAADGLKVWHSRSVYENNVIHDCGRHGIGVLPFGGNVAEVSDVTIGHNTFFNGFHTTGVDVEVGDANRMSNFTFINNQFLGTPDYDLGAEDAFNSNHIWTEPDDGTLADFRFINNLFTYCHGKGIAINAIDGSEVYHNTFYGVNPTLSNTQGQLYYVGAIKNAKVRNNIFYNDVDTSFNGGFYSVKLDSAQMPAIDMDYNLHYTTDPDAPMVKIVGRTGSYQTDEWDTYKAETGWDTHSPTPQGPRFVGPDNYHLQPGSPARAVGTYIVSVNKDKDGYDRANPPSIGAYE